MRLLKTGSGVLATFVAALAAGGATGGLDRGDFGPFKRSLNTKPYGYALVSDPTGAAPTTVVERFEVRPGDCDDDDCHRDRERSELSERGARNGRGSSAWYGWSFYVPQEWPTVWPTKTVLGQFHQGSAHPLWMFLHHEDGLVLDRQTQGKTESLTPLISERELRGRWHRVEVHAKWATDANGTFEVWVNGSRKYAMKGQTMTADTVFFKYGVYRAFVSRYANSMQASPPVQVAMFANVRKAALRAGVKKRHSE
jgi:Polysaccharide lyase